MVFDDEINKIGEKLNIGEIETWLVNNLIPMPEEFGRPSRGNTHFMRPKHFSIGCTINFFCGFISRKTTTFEEIYLTPIS